MQISVVIPVYNEEGNIPVLFTELNSVLPPLGMSYEMIFVNDGSTDRSAAVLEELRSKHAYVKVLKNIINQGQEASLKIGIFKASGDFIICMDGDLQHPVQHIPQMVQKANEGHDSVCMIRQSSFLKNGIWHTLSLIFYFLLRLIKRRKTKAFSSDYFLITKDLSEKINVSTIFLRGFIQEKANRPAYISYQPNKRKFGKSKYSFLSKLKQAFQILKS